MSGLLLAVLITTSAFATEWVKKLSLPKGFKVEKIIEAKDARQMTRSPDGTLYVGTMQAGLIYQLREFCGTRTHSMSPKFIASLKWSI